MEATIQGLRSYVSIYVGMKKMEAPILGLRSYVSVYSGRMEKNMEGYYLGFRA